MAETDAAFKCYRGGRITSVSAMVFMHDSGRAAELAKANELLGITSFFLKNLRIRFLKGNKYAQLLYNPFLRKAFAYCYHAQVEEFVRLFEKSPSHIDGHHHMQLCANLVLSKSIPAGMKMRRNFSFWPGEKGFLNRAYRSLVDRWLARRYRLAAYFFDLTQCIEGKKLDRVAAWRSQAMWNS